jgi:3-methylfumaryl-CoA hydratase
VSLDEADIAHWKSWVGKTARRTERLDPEALRRFAHALGEEAAVERVQPPLAHWAFFLPEMPAGELGVDGHRKRGGFLPPVSLPRRMFAAAEMRFGGPLLLGEEATQIATVRSVTHKSGKTGELVLVEVEQRLQQGGTDRVVEVQTIIYREAGGAPPAVIPAAIAPEEGDIRWDPSTVELFRFSAVTFNAHRIHYDLPYATGEEGYPGLVVHGPLTATRLFGLARRKAPPRTYSFRAMAPLFQGQPILLRPGDGEGDFKAVRCDGQTAMAATASYA